MNSSPSIMVSSTFYDLNQIRTDLYEFISQELGYQPLLSELPSFPVDPDIDTIENCRKRVENDADIMVLIIGGRYGSIDADTDKSITNLEFLTARTKGIPIYVFIKKDVLSILPIWKSNPIANFSAVTDTPRIFEFIELVRSGEKVWTFGFETAQEIIATLRLQFAYLFQDSLKLRQLLSGKGIPRYMDLLSPKALRIVLEQSEAWEARLFCRVLIDEVDLRYDMISEYKNGLKLNSVLFISQSDAIEWILTQNHHMENLVESLNILINSSLQHAFKEKGIPGNPEEIIWVARMVGRVLEQMLQWAINIRCARFEEPFDIVGKEMALFGDDIVAEIIRYPKESLKKIEDALLSLDPNKKVVLDLTFRIDLSNLDRFQEALDEAKRQLGL